MSRHIDKFEKICGQMAHNNPTKPPTEEQKIDWFLDSVTERTYDSVHANCTDKLLEGNLTFAKMLKLYTHKCFQRYPHFQVEDLDRSTDKTLSNNSTTVRTKGNKGSKGKGHPGKGRGRGRDRNPRAYQSHPSRSDSTRSHKGKGKGAGKGSRTQSQEKGKGKSNSRNQGNSTPNQDPCSYCGGARHNARDCYKRLAEEKGQPAQVHKQANQNLIIDETVMEFSQSVLSIYSTEPHTVNWGENEPTEDNTEQTIDSDANSQDNDEQIQTEQGPTQDTQDNSIPTYLQPNGESSLVGQSLPSTDQEIWTENKHNADKDLNKNDKERETDSGEDYKEDPWYYTQESETNTDQAQPKTEDDLTLNRPPVDIGLPSNEEEKACPRQGLTKKVGKELKQAFKLQNDVLQKLFRPEPTVTPSSKDDREEQESSTAETILPTTSEWGRTRQNTLQQHTEDWQVWEETNRNTTTIAYRHDRCHDCRKPVSTTSLDPHRVLLCYECTPNVIHEDSYDLHIGQTGYERRDRDDEEE